MKRILYLGLDPHYYSFEGELTHCPLIEIVPRPLQEINEVLKNFEVYSHLLFTSKTAVMILENYLKQLGITQGEWAKKVLVAVGRVTAHHLRRIGGSVEVAKEETAEGIVELLKRLSIPISHIFWPHSSLSRSIIKDYFIKEKICHTTCALYDTQKRQPSPLPCLAEFNEAIFTSPSTVHAFLEIFKEFPPHLKLVAIGPVTFDFLLSKGANSNSISLSSSRPTTAS